MLNEIRILGVPYPVEYSAQPLNKASVVHTSNKIIVYPSILKKNLKHNEILLNWLKVQAKRHIIKRTRDLAERYGFEYKRIAVKDQSSRWGSCSSLGNLNFNWRLFLAPSVVLDYVIIHELAHTQQMNHSKAFWNIVEKIMPEFRKSKLWLKTNGNNLMRMI